MLYLTSTPICSQDFSDEIRSDLCRLTAMWGAHWFAVLQPVHCLVLCPDIQARFHSSTHTLHLWYQCHSPWQTALNPGCCFQTYTFYRLRTDYHYIASQSLWINPQQIRFNPSRLNSWNTSAHLERKSANFKSLNYDSLQASFLIMACLVWVFLSLCKCQFCQVLSRNKSGNGGQSTPHLPGKLKKCNVNSFYIRQQVWFYSK